MSEFKSDYYPYTVEWADDYETWSKAKIAELQAENAKINREYNKLWNVLRTYNPLDIELQYIGFETIEGQQ